MRGRLPILAEKKELSGTLRKDRIKCELKFTPLTIIPNSPDWLDTGSKKIFKNVSSLLIEKSILYDADIHLLAILAKEISIYEMACKELKTKKDFLIDTPNGFQQQSPWVAIRSQAQKNVREIGSLFGLDPLSRSRFNINTEKPEVNPFEKL